MVDQVWYCLAFVATLASVASVDIMAPGSLGTPSAPDPMQSRSPLPAVPGNRLAPGQDDGTHTVQEVPVQYDAINGQQTMQPLDSNLRQMPFQTENGVNQVEQQKINGTQHYILHPGDLSGYNVGNRLKDSADSDGFKSSDRCPSGELACRVCPKDPKCVESGRERCFSICHTVCGEACNIENMLTQENAPQPCVIGVDCGMMQGNVFDSPGVVRQGEVSDAENMAVNATQPAVQTHATPLNDQARAPLPALEAGNGGGDLKDPCAGIPGCGENGMTPGDEPASQPEVVPPPPPPAPKPPPVINVHVNGQGVEGGGSSGGAINIDAATLAAATPGANTQSLGSDSVLTPGGETQGSDIVGAGAGAGADGSGAVSATGDIVGAEGNDGDDTIRFAALRGGTEHFEEETN